MKALKKLFPVLIVLAVAVFFVDDSEVTERLPAESPAWTSGSDSVIGDAFASRRSDVQVEGIGQVVRVLPDDNEGSRHQRFILRLRSGQTLLIAHNIDLAPRLPNLQVGATVEFFGEYEWNDRGGVVHWTHRDPQGRHVDGWLRYQGRTYQ